MLHLFCIFVLNIKGYIIHHLDLHSGFMATVYLRNDLTNKYIRKQWFWVPFLVHDISLISQIENVLKFKPIFYHIWNLPHGLLWHYIQCSKRDVLLVDTLSTQDYISTPSSCYRQWICNIDCMIRSNFKCVVACVKHRSLLIWIRKHRPWVFYLFSCNTFGSILTFSWSEPAHIDIALMPATFEEPFLNLL